MVSKMRRGQLSLAVLILVVTAWIMAACGGSMGGSEGSGSSGQEAQSQEGTGGQREAPDQSDNEEKVLRVAMYGEPGTLDFMYQSSMPATWVDWNLYDQLARYNYETNELMPELATEWYQEDEDSWIVKLREGVQFHKGYGEMTAEDVAFSVNYVIENAARIAFLYAGVENVEVVDRYTVRYNLEQPLTPFLMTAVQGFGGLVLSKKAYEERGREEFSRNPVGTGPFEFVEWAAGDHITLKKFEDYWDEGYPMLDRVVFRFVPDDSVRLNLLKTGEVDFIQGIAFKDLAEIDENPDLVLHSVAGWNWDYISFGTVNGPLGDVRVRQAISYAINRNEIVEGVYYGYGDPAEKPLPPGFMFENPAITKYPAEGDPERARQLLAEAGYEDGLRLRAITNGVEAHHRELQIVAQQLKDVGIELDLQFLDLAAYEEANSRFETYLDMEDITIMSPDPDSAIFWFWHTGGVLTHDYSNETVDDLLQEGRRLVTPDDRQPVYEELQRTMLEEAWFIYTAHKPVVRAMGTHLTGYETTPQDMDIYFKYTDINQ